MSRTHKSQSRRPQHHAQQPSKNNNTSPPSVSPFVPSTTTSPVMIPVPTAPFTQKSSVSSSRNQKQNQEQAKSNHGPQQQFTHDPRSTGPGHMPPSSRKEPPFQQQQQRRQSLPNNRRRSYDHSNRIDKNGNGAPLRIQTGQQSKPYYHAGEQDGPQVFTSQRGEEQPQQQQPHSRHDFGKIKREEPMPLDSSYGIREQIPQTNFDKTRDEEYKSILSPRSYAAFDTQRSFSMQPHSYAANMRLGPIGPPPKKVPSSSSSSPTLSPALHLNNQHQQFRQRQEYWPDEKRDQVVVKSALFGGSVSPLLTQPKFSFTPDTVNAPAEFAVSSPPPRSPAKRRRRKSVDHCNTVASNPTSNASGDKSPNSSPTPTSATSFMSANSVIGSKRRNSKRRKSRVSSDPTPNSKATTDNNLNSLNDMSCDNFDNSNNHEHVGKDENAISSDWVNYCKEVNTDAVDLDISKNSTSHSKITSDTSVINTQISITPQQFWINDHSKLSSSKVPANETSQTRKSDSLMFLNTRPFATLAQNIRSASADMATNYNPPNFERLEDINNDRNLLILNADGKRENHGPFALRYPHNGMKRAVSAGVIAELTQSSSASTAINDKKKQKGKVEEKKENINTCDSEMLAMLLNNLLDFKKRVHALGELCKIREQCPNFPHVIWRSFGIITVLLDEVMRVYPFLHPPTLSMTDSNRACNALALMQSVASCPELRPAFVSTMIPMFLYPLLETRCLERNFEYLRLTSLSVIGALVKTETHNVVRYLLTSGLLPHCLRILEIGRELSKVVAAFVLQRLLQDPFGLTFVAHTYDRRIAVIRALDHAVQAIETMPNPRLFKNVLRCYILLCTVSGQETMSSIIVPVELVNGTLDAHLQEDTTCRRLYRQLQDTVRANNIKVGSRSSSNKQIRQTR